jgi:DNA-binding winged helix-turn-helix (wHTH) protein/pimeloyl-ACP methyl ester carboxylesterase
MLGRGTELLYCFEHYVLDTERRELRCGTELVPLAPQAYDLLEHLIRNRDRVLSKDELIASVWNGRIISDSALTTRINAVRRAIGDNGDQQLLIKTIPRKGIRFVAPVREGRKLEADVAANTRADRPTSNTPHLVQNIKFRLSRDGTRIAYATCGAGPPVVWAARFMSHLLVEWDSPVWRPWIDLFSRRNTLIRYDGRGCGLSDREQIQFSLDNAVEDLNSVIEAAQIETFTLLGISSGGAIAMRYTDLHPERVKHLILYGAYTRGWLTRSVTPQQREAANTQIKAIEAGWGQENPAFRQLYTSLWIPQATVEQARSFNELIRQSTTPLNATKLMKMAFALDSRATAARVQRPTFVLHARGDSIAPFEEGCALAGLVAGARFVPLESQNHLILETEPAFSQLTQEIEMILVA